MKQVTFNEFKKIQNQQNYQYLSVVEQNGQTLIPFNSNRTKIETRMAEIEKRLSNNPMLEDGVYIIKAKNSPSKTVKTDDFAIVIGKPKNISLSEAQTPKIIESVSPDFLTYEAALALNVENQRLQLENRALTKEVEILNTKINTLNGEIELLSEEEDGKSDLMGNVQTFLSQAMNFASPLLDKHFELKEKALNLRAHEISLKMGSQQKKQQQQVTPQMIIEKYIHSFSGDEDTYEELANIYNSAASETEFFDLLHEFKEGVYYKELTEKLQEHGFNGL